MKTRILGLLAGLCLLACGPRKTAAPAEVAFPSRLDIPSVYSDPAASSFEDSQAYRIPRFR